MLPLLLLTDSAAEMGKQFKNSMWVKICGWISVIGLTILNMINMPSSFAAFVGAGQIGIAHIAAYITIGLIIALLAWCLYDMHRSNQALIASKGENNHA